MGLIAAVGTAVKAVAASVGVAVTATALTVGFTTIAAVGRRAGFRKPCRRCHAE